MTSESVELREFPGKAGGLPNDYYVNKKNRFAASAALQSRTGYFDLPDTDRGTPTLGAPESV
jgi:hypothetical protein